mgnify:CR=1 FL=1
MFYVASLLLPLFGIIIGAMYLSKKDDEHRTVGTICLVLGILDAVVVIPTLLAALLYIMVLGM